MTGCKVRGGRGQIVEDVPGLWLLMQGQWETLEVSGMQRDMICLVRSQDHPDICAETRLK